MLDKVAPTENKYALCLIYLKPAGVIWDFITYRMQQHFANWSCTTFLTDYNDSHFISAWTRSGILLPAPIDAHYINQSHHYTIVDSSPSSRGRQIASYVSREMSISIG